MAKAIGKFIRDLSAGLSGGGDTEIDIGPLEVSILRHADKSDPLNQLLAVGFRVGKRCGGRAVIDRDFSSKSPYRDLPRVIAGLLVVAIENAAEIRDAIAMEKAD